MSYVISYSFFHHRRLSHVSCVIAVVFFVDASFNIVRATSMLYLPDYWLKFSCSILPFQHSIIDVFHNNRVVVCKFHSDISMHVVLLERASYDIFWSSSFHSHRFSHLTSSSCNWRFLLYRCLLDPLWRHVLCNSYFSATFCMLQSDFTTFYMLLLGLFLLYAVRSNFIIILCLPAF